MILFVFLLAFASFLPCLKINELEIKIGLSLSLKGQIVYIFSFADHMVSLPLLCHKSSHRWEINEWVGPVLAHTVFVDPSVGRVFLCCLIRIFSQVLENVNEHVFFCSCHLSLFPISVKFCSMLYIYIY